MRKAIAQFVRAKYKEVKTTFVYRNGHKDTATFLLDKDSNHPNNPSIERAIGEYAMKQFRQGAIKSTTVARFV
jgi:hypothetical protein